MTGGKSVNVKTQTETVETVAVALTACCWCQEIYICMSKLLLLFFMPIEGTVWHALHWPDNDPCDEAC